MTIRNRVIVYFAVLTLVICLIFSAVSVLFMLITEDLTFEYDLLKEKNHVLQDYDANGQFNSPKNEAIKLYFDAQEFPLSIRQRFIADSSQKEISTEDGANYHILQVLDTPNVYLVGEFSEQLVVNRVTLDIVLILAAVTGLLLLICISIAYFLANRAVKPLSNLVGLLQESSPENLPAKFAHRYSADEVGYLAQNLESTLARITDFIEREQHFTRDVSHELRTPIAVVKGAGELLAQQQPSAAVNRLNSAVLHMEQIVETLLNLAREEKDWSHKQQLKLLPIVEEIVINHARFIEDKAVEVEIKLCYQDEVFAHPVALDILLANIISNAFKHIEQGKVAIGYYDGRLTICDTGQGIEQQLQNTLFESGVKGQQSSGFGVGLSLVKRLCARQNIGISIQSGANGTVVELQF